MIDVLVSWSAALAVWGLGAAGLCIWRLIYIRNEIEIRRALLLGSAASLSLGIGYQQAIAWWAWETGAWGVTVIAPASGLFYRIALTVGLFGLAGATSWPRCGHRGWSALAAVGVAVWLIALAI